MPCPLWTARKHRGAEAARSRVSDTYTRAVPFSITCERQLLPAEYVASLLDGTRQGADHELPQIGRMSDIGRDGGYYFTVRWNVRRALTLAWIHRSWPLRVPGGRRVVRG